MGYPQTAFAASTVHPQSLIGRRRAVVEQNTLHYQLDVLKETGRYKAFDLKWQAQYADPPMVEPIPNHLFFESDIGKWIEGACYLLKQQPSAKIDAAISELVQMIRSAQQPDGYLNIHYTVVQPGKRFSNLKDMHELYNLGHLIEGALAHNDLYNNNLLLEPILKYVDLVDQTFGPGPNQIHGYPGHPEIELALLRLYERTQDSRHLSLATYFITERGNLTGQDEKHFFEAEAEKRNADVLATPAFYPRPKSWWYHQAHLPIVDQPTIEGHSVRAVYLLTAVADLLRIQGKTPNADLQTALLRLWDNMVDRKTYVTGGIGAIPRWEGFGHDFELPQETAYAETCASIGLMLLAERLLQIDLDSRYADVMELTLYNTVLTSMSYDGKKFTYDNRLASADDGLSKREEWFTCACCPPNVLRLLAQIGGFVWNYHIGSSQNADITTHLYVPSTLNFALGEGEVSITQGGDWPWNGDIPFKISAPSDCQLNLRLRIPQYSQGSYEIVPACAEAVLQKGYLAIPPKWLQENKGFTLRLSTKPRWVVQHPFAQPRIVALARGPIIYCAEDVDNAWVQDHFKTVAINTTTSIVEEHATTDETSGDSYVGLTVRKGAFTIPTAPFEASPVPYVDVEAADRASEASTGIEKLIFVPYYFRANRGGRGQMRVGFQRTFDHGTAKTNGVH